MRTANDTSYGLAAVVWTNDAGLAHRIARACRPATCTSITYDHADISMLFGGYRESGIGVD